MVVERALVPWQRVRVAGPSMVPTLRPGDVLVVRRTRVSRARPGDVVLARFDDVAAPVVKRLTSWRADGRAIVASDNDAAAGDSRTHGPARVLGVAVLRLRGWRPARLPARPVV